MKVTLSLSAILAMAAAFSLAAPAWCVPWHHPLYLDGGGYWSNRVTLTASSSAALNGVSKTITLGTGADQIDLIGAEARSIRVIDEDGHDLLYGLSGPNGEPRRLGPLKAGDLITVPIECLANAKKRIYVYFGNPKAGELPDFLSGGFANGGFEAGEEEPSAWSKWGGDADHHLEWVTDGAHSGKRCVRAAAAPQATSTWFKYLQTGMPVVPGQRYVLRGWVRAEDVKGSAGWYVHVNGVRPQMINYIMSGGEGSYGWKEFTYEFTVPEGGATADVGTVLYGTGRAWYDDCSLTTIEQRPTFTLSPGPVESIGLREAKVCDGWLLKARARLPLRVCNFSPAPYFRALISAAVRRALVVSRARPSSVSVHVYDASSCKELPALLEDSKVTFRADLPARSMTTFHLYVTGKSALPPGTTLKPDDLVVGPLNRVQNPDFEEGDGLPTGWDLSAQSADGKARATGRRVAGGKTGGHCIEMTIPSGVDPAWSGWHQVVPVDPNAKYLLGGWMKTKDVDGTVTLYAHLLNGEKQLVSSNSMVGSSPSLSGTTDWTWTQTIVATQADARFLELHLTMNAHGTVCHDGIVVKRLADTLPAQVLALESPPSGGRGSQGLSIWQENPIVKVFRDEPTGSACKAVSVRLARNEREPVQLVLKSDKPLRGIHVSVSPLKGAPGKTLPAVEIARVDYVPVDYPTNYYTINVPAWQRKVPTGTPSSDGWVGEWPDPLPPLKQLGLEAIQAQPIWLTVHAPEEATPGVYRSEITITGPAIHRVIPLSVTVRTFTLPKRPSIQITYDGHIVTGAEGRRWFRFMAEHRASPGYLPDPPVKLLPNGEAQMDFAEFDKMASYCFDELDMSMMYTPWYFYALGWAYSPQKFLDLEAFTPAWEKAFGSAYRQYTDHVRQKGWLDRMVLYLSDEPADRKEVIENLNKFSKFLQSIAPEVPIYSSTWGYMPGLKGAVTRWGPGHYGVFPVERMKERSAAGDRLCFTTDGQQCIDTPYAGTERMLSWYCFKYDVGGHEFWGVNWYTYDPWKFGGHNFIQQAYSEKEAPYWVRYPNGDGYLTYPGKPVGVEGPVTSIRLEAVRDGEEDYEYFLLLRQRIEAARKAGKNTSTAQAALDRAMNLISIPNPGGLRTSDYIKDPDEILKRRDEIGDRIEALK